MEYQVVTVANKIPMESYYTFHEHFRSLGNTESLVLGTNPGQYGGLGSKPRLIHQAIKEGGIPTKYIIFCDCFDLVFACDIDELFETFLAFNSPFVISAERNCFPDTYKKEYDKLNPNGSSYQYLNSGMIVAETEALYAVLEHMDAANIPNDYWDGEKMVNPNDQEYYQKVFLEQPVKMTLDYDQILCNTLHDVIIDDLDFSKERIRNWETKTYPCSFHLNGGSKTGGLREPILKHLKLM